MADVCIVREGALGSCQVLAGDAGAESWRAGHQFLCSYCQFPSICALVVLACSGLQKTLCTLDKGDSTIIVNELLGALQMFMSALLNGRQDVGSLAGRAGVEVPPAVCCGRCGLTELSNALAVVMSGDRSVVFFLVQVASPLLSQSKDPRRRRPPVEKLRGMSVDARNDDALLR